MSKRKDNREHFVNSVWCICGVEKNNSSKCFVVPVENRNSETIKKVLRSLVLPGSIVYTDSWKAYLKPYLNLIHKTVNYSKEFKDSLTGVHTNTVEGFNNALKLVIKARNRTKIGINVQIGFLLCRRQNKKDLWNVFINALHLN